MPRLLKSLIRRQPSNRPSSRLFPHRSPPLCRTTTTVALHHRTGATSSTPSSTAPGGPPTTSVAATDVPHRHRVPPHQVRFTDAVSQLTRATSPSTSSYLHPPRPLRLHQRSRPPHRVVHRQHRRLQPTCLTDIEFHRIRCASPTPSPSSPGLLHRAHRRTSAPRGHWGFTNGLVHRIVVLRYHSRSASVRGQPTPAHHPQRL